MLPDVLFGLAAAVLLIALTLGGMLWWKNHTRVPEALPSEWPLTARPVFNTDERRVYRQLREALPHHIVLSKLPLVRFCQPADPQQVRYWYELLGAVHVGFAICSANGRVLAAIDIDTERGNSRRALQIKQRVLAACRVRYLRCPVDHLPSIPELQLLVPQQVAASRGPQPAPAQAAPTAARREAPALWRDSGFFHDSFFSSEIRQEPAAPSEFGALVRGLPRDEPNPGDLPPMTSRPVRH